MGIVDIRAKEYFDKQEERWAAYTAQLRMW